MSNPQHITSLSLAGLLLVTVFGGCGQKGVLMLPDAQHPRKKSIPGKSTAAPAQPPAPGLAHPPPAPPAPPPTGAPGSAPLDHTTPEMQSDLTPQL